MTADRERWVQTGTADLSSCGSYRYELTRSFNPQDLLGRLGPLTIGQPCVFIMLNPSTADATEDDPTLRRCVGFAKREGFFELVVVNLFALRSADPRALKSHPDPIGPRNDDALLKAAQGAGLVVAAWGANPFAVDRANDVSEGLLSWGVEEIKCLGVNADGSPRHPLYTPGLTKLETWLRG